MNWFQALQKLTRRRLVPSGEEETVVRKEKMTVILQKGWTFTLEKGWKVIPGEEGTVVLQKDTPGEEETVILQKDTLGEEGTVVLRKGSQIVTIKKRFAQQKNPSEKNGPRLILPPGARLREILHTIYPRKTAERVFDQAIADMQLEWQEAIIHEKKWLARWVQVRGVLTVFLAAAVHLVATLSSFFKLVKSRS